MTATFEQTRRHAEQITGVSNVAYDLMVVLTNKLQGIAAMESYKEDAKRSQEQEVSALFDRIVQRDRQDVDEIRDLLVGRLDRVRHR